MTKCLTQDCNEEAKTGYKYCLDCYTRWKERQAESASTKSTTKAWHDDPTVEQLMKINANLGKVAQHLERIAACLEERRM